MNHFSKIATLEKNKLSTDAPFLILVQVNHAALVTPIYLVRNTEDIVWRDKTWTAFPMELDNYEEDGKTLPALNLKISSGGGLLTTYLQKYDGLVDAKVSIFVANAKLLDVPEPEIELDFVVNSANYDEQWISFTLGASSEIADRFPMWRYLTDFCPFVCGDIRCGYLGAKQCRNNLESCLIPERFGGEPGIQEGR